MAGRNQIKALQEMVVAIVGEVSQPLNAMKKILDRLADVGVGEKNLRYLNLMKDNVNRIEKKMEKLQNLKDDKTVQYIKDIKMIDLS